MYLDKIELHGFKSFAQRTIIDFPKPKDKKTNSVTVIVGPNGSGKSNIVDALRWVMGEQSSKSLRGKSSQDVIFSGSHSKSRMGMAEVTLYFNNEDKSAPVDYTEIVITRRIYRDGESEYLLNNNKARLSDIIMLLAQCNVGQKAYGIIGQGMITEIIGSSPTERKAFFDEATGIKQYQIRRDQASNKIKRTQENIEQSTTILEELEPRLKLLTRQVKKLEQRKSLEIELKELQATYYSALLSNLETEESKTKENIAHILKDKVNLETTIQTLQQEIEKLSHTESRSHIYNELQKEYNTILVEKEKLHKTLATLKGQTSVEYSKAGKQNLSWLESKEDELNQKIKEAHETIETLTKDYDRLSASIHESEQELETVGKEFNQIDLTLAQAQQQSGESYAVAKHHIKTLLKQKNTIPGIIGTVSELGTVDPNYLLALEVAAGSHLESVVVQTDETARQCISFLKENRLGTVTFLPQNTIRPFSIYDSARNASQSHGAIGLAIDLVNFDDHYSNIFSYILRSTIIVEDIQAAQNIGIGSERMVTLEGDLIEKSGALRGGFRRYRSSMTFNQANNNEIDSYHIEQLEEKRIQLLQRKNQIERELNQSKIEREIKKSQQQHVKNNIKALEQERDSITKEIKHSSIAPEQAPELLKQLQEEKIEAQKQLTVIEETLTKKREQIDNFNREEEEKKQHIFDLQDKKQVHQNTLNEVNNTYNTSSNQLTRIETKKEDLITELIEELGVNYNAHLSKTIDEKVNIETLHTTIQSIKQKLHMIGGIDEEVIQEYQEVKERYDFLEEQLTDLNTALTDTQHIINELDAIIKKQFSTAFKKINKEFSEHFAKLFDGGKAKLELIQMDKPEPKQIISDTGEVINIEDDIEPKQTRQKDDLQNAGIEIRVSPPKKKINNLSSLSGGEKTMTALALLSAIIINNPPPFVFLDEVDAALDEANSAKLADVLHDLSHKTQFVIISHNRVIMHAAHLLYGVAMNNDGITQLLSVDMNEAEKIAEQM